LVPTPGGVPSKDLVPSLLAASDVLGTGWFAADAANVKAGGTVVVVGPKALDHGDVAHSGKVVGIRSLVLNRLRCAGRYEKERRLPARYKGEQKSQRQSEGRQPNNNAAFSEPPGTTVNLGSIRCQTVSNRDHYRHQGKTNNISFLIQEKNLSAYSHEYSLPTVLGSGRKRQSGLAGFAIEVPGMGVVGVFGRPFALDERLGFRFRTNEPKLGRRELFTGDEMAHADFVDRFLLARFL